MSSGLPTFVSAPRSFPSAVSAIRRPAQPQRLRPLDWHLRGHRPQSPWRRAVDLTVRPAQARVKRPARSCRQARHAPFFRRIPRWRVPTSWPPRTLLPPGAACRPFLARSPRGRRVLHSHFPPPPAAMTEKTTSRPPPTSSAATSSRRTCRLVVFGPRWTPAARDACPTRWPALSARSRCPAWPRFALPLASPSRTPPPFQRPRVSPLRRRTRHALAPRDRHRPRPAMEQTDSRELEPPVVLPLGHREPDLAVLGRTKFRSRRDVFGIRGDDRRRHLAIIGKTGMGKTTLLRQLIASDIAAGRGLALSTPTGILPRRSSMPSRRTAPTTWSSSTPATATFRWRSIRWPARIRHNARWSPPASSRP